MKKTFTKFAFLLSLILIITACEKEEIDNPVNEDQTTAQLLDFKNFILDRTSSRIPADSAMLMLEGLLNLEFANNSHMIENISSFSDTVFIPVSSDSVLYSDLSDVYAILSDILEDTMFDAALTDVVDLAISSVLSTETSLSVVFNVTFGPEMQQNRGQYPAVGPTDFWYAMYDAGKCDIYAGQSTGSDAADVLQYSFNHPTAVPATRYYYTSIQTIEVYPYDDPVGYPNPYADYKLWSYVGYEPNECLSPDEINFYISWFPSIRDKYCPSGKQYINTLVNGSFWTIQFGDPNSLFHYYRIKYGIPHIGTNSSTN